MGKSKYTNDFKVSCIENGLVEFVRKERKKIYKDENEDVVDWLFCVGHNADLDCSVRLLESQYRKYVRARKHIQDLVLSGNAIFITLTFTNDVLEKTSADTRRRYVARYLKSQSDFYVANIDYSPGKQREHYHAVVGKRCDMDAWRFGFVWCEKVRAFDWCSNKVARYIAKLTSHAFKVDCSRLIYSRNVIL